MASMMPAARVTGGSASETGWLGGGKRSRRDASLGYFCSDSVIVRGQVGGELWMEPREKKRCADAQRELTGAGNSPGTQRLFAFSSR